LCVLIFSVSPERTPPTPCQGEPVGTKWTRRVESGYSLRPFLPLDSLPPAFPWAPPFSGRSHSAHWPLRPELPLIASFAFDPLMTGSSDVSPIALRTLKTHSSQTHVTLDALGSGRPGRAGRTHHHGCANGGRRVSRSEGSSTTAAAIFARSTGKSHGSRTTDFALGSNLAFRTKFS